MSEAKAIYNGRCSVRELDKREWIAGIAMQGIVAASSKIDTELVAKIAVNLADDLLKELAKK